MSRLRLTSLALVFLIVSMCMTLFFWPLPSLLQAKGYSRAIYADQQQLLRLTLSPDGKYRLYTSLPAFSPQLISATLLQEDQYFYSHPGINPVSLLKAAWQTLTGKRRIGASTITMQVARIRYGIHSRTFSGKLQQIFRALQLEMHYSKNQILEAYLNLASYGNNIEGAGAASLIYFGKQASELNLPEALTLVVIPQHPAKRVPHRGEIKNIRDKLYARWLMQHPEDNQQKALFSLPLQVRNIHHIPFLAPHFVDDILSNPAIHPSVVHTTLDLRLQKIIETITTRYIARKSALGVNNAAVLLVDTRDMSIKTMLGSADFFNQKIGGQINGTAVRRSPGSTLKPFIYALALDQGLIHPATLLKDVPHYFGNYNPENFDNDFMGPLSAKEALTLSRNIPAIALAEQLKNPGLYEFLQQANVADLQTEKYYGLALVLGGAEMTMQELTMLYAMLANDGIWQPLQVSKERVPHNKNKRLLSAEASFLVLDMLRDGDMAWKTGTSSGYRDAWTIGIAGHYVLAVWIGNFNNESNQAFIGKQIAAPLFREITQALQHEMGKAFVFPVSNTQMNLVKIDVCKASGMLPTKFCPATEKVWFISGKSPINADTIYREIAINAKTGLRACQFDQHTRFEIYEFWSSDLLRIFKRAGIARRIPPAYDAGCTLGAKAGEGLSPQIISPLAQVDYVARLATQQTRIPLTAVVDADVRNIYWYLNAGFLGKSTRDKSFIWQAKPGKYVLRAVDDYGRSDVREVVVRGEG